MGILVHSQPEAYGLANNDNPYVFRSTNYTTTQRFKVVVLPSNFPVDPAISTARVYPRQGIDSNGVVTTDRAYYDPSRILQTQVGSDIAIPAVNHAGIFNAPNTHKEYALFVQEEDLVGGVYVGGTTYTVNVKSVWNGVRNTIDWLDFDYTDYDTSVVGKKFLSDAPSTRYIDSDQSAFLHFLSVGVAVNKSIGITSYDSDGIQVSTGAIDGASMINNEYCYTACGTYDIENSDPSAWTSGNPATILVGAASYKVWVRVGSVLSEEITFNIDQKCSKYTPIRLHFLNRLGGYDSFNFNLKSKEETKVKRDSYVQQSHNFTGTSWDYTKASRGRTEFNTEMTEKLTINTDYLTESESAWMGDLFTSPVIYQELNNEMIAVNIDGRSIKKQTSLNDKLMQYEFDLEYSLTNHRQRG